TVPEATSYSLRAERKQVGASIKFLTSHLLGRHICHGAQRRTGTGQVLFRIDGRGAHANALRFQRDFREPEIQNFRLTSIRNEDVRWLDVSMDDALRMCCIERVGNLDAEIEHRFDLQRFSSDLVLEGLTFEVLHSDEGPSFIFPNVVNRADIRVIECRGSASLLLKALKCLPILGHSVRKELQRDMPT